MSNNRITPFVKRMRTNGGTIYTFSSAVEDIGLNINERNNVVKISHFALLDIPPINFDSSDLDRNFFNIKAINGAFEYESDSASIKDGRVLIAESFQNYALNLESNLLNRADYNPTLVRTVSERVLWKWLKETGAIRWDKDVSVSGTQYWSEELDADGSLGYNSIVKYVGLVSASNVRTDSFGTYNETYILVPTSHGQTDAYFEIVEDDNYQHGMEIGDLSENILGRASYTLPHPDGLAFTGYYDFVDSSTTIGAYTMTADGNPGWWYTAEGFDPASANNAYLTDTSSYITSGVYNVDLAYSGGSDDFSFRRSKVDCLSLVFDLDKLKGIYGDTELTYDKMAIQNAVNDNFNFNAVLIYYTVYNSTQEDVLGRNLLGILFLDAPSGSSQDIGISGISIPSLEKIQSGPTGFGTSYSLRLNIKTDNMVDDTGATIVDMATSDQLYAEDWTAAFANLNTAVNLLVQNTSVIQNISQEYIEVQTTQTQILNDLQALQYQVNDIGKDIKGTENAIAMFADGDDPLVESSIYMRQGNVGVANNNPQYPLHVSGTTKLDEVIIQNAIRDTSGNILLGYGSPLQIGSSTNYREVNIYTGNNNPAFHFDTSNNSTINGDVSISGTLNVDGSTRLAYLDVSTIVSSSFNFDKSYIPDTSINTGTLEWDINGLLNVKSTTTVEAAGEDGNIQFNSGGVLDASYYLMWKPSTRRLGVGVKDPSVSLHVSGEIRTDGSINISGDYYKNGTIFNGIDVTSPANNALLKSDGTATGVIADSSLSSDGNTFKVAKNIDFFINNMDGDKGFSLTGTQLQLGDSDGVFLEFNFSGGLTRLYSGTALSDIFTIEALGDTSIAGNLSIGGDLYVGGMDAATSSNIVYYDTTAKKLTYGAAPSPSGSGGDVYWASGSVGSNNQIITANGDGSIVSESGLTYSGTSLDVSGNITLGLGNRTISITGSGSTGGNLILQSGVGATTAGSLYLYPGSGSTRGNTYINGDNNTNYGDNIYFYAGNAATEKLTISSTNIQPTVPLRFPDSSSYIIQFSNDDNTGLYWNSTSRYLDINDDGVVGFRFSVDSGKFEAAEDIIGYSSTISDIRLKEDVQDLVNPLDKILQVRGISYTRKKDGSRHLGVIAQEIESVIPEVVVETPLFMETNDPSTLYKMVRYVELIPYLIESIKQQQQMIDELRSEIDSMKQI